MQKILAIDAGGTSTRAVIATADGHGVGFGTAGSGNPISAGLDGALDSFATAAERAQASYGQGPQEFSCILIAMAGKSAGVSLDLISARLSGLGARGPVETDSDLLAMFCSGTASPNGYALVAGTGAVAARVRNRRLERVCGGTGWLLGDDGSGFWIGQRVARAVVAALDGLGPQTALTGLLLQSLALECGPENAGEHIEGRPEVLLRLLETLYALRPVELSRFAPLAFQAGDDAVARAIVSDAASALVDTLATVRTTDAAGPLVLGGSVLNDGLLGADSPVAATLRGQLHADDAVCVQDGAVGATVLALLRVGTEVDPRLFERIGRDVARLRGNAEATTTGATR